MNSRARISAFGLALYPILTLVLPSQAGAANSFPTSGNAGVGTTSPPAPLFIQAPFVSAYTQMAIQATGSDDRAGLSFWSTANTRTGIIYVANNGDFIFGRDQPGELRFFSNNVERLTIDTGGNVGIGTTTPGTALQVGASFEAETAAAVWVNNQLNGGTKATPGDLYLNYGAQSNDTYIQGTKVVVKSSGNVGIGTVTPGSRLEVAGDIYANGGGLSASLSSSLGGNLRLYNPTKTGATTNNWTLWNMTAPYGNGLAFWRYFADGTNPGPSVWFADNGNVGIGTTNPTQKLSVYGTIQAKEVIVQTGWSDYVFVKNYVLQPLSAVEQSIKKEGHLPGIPSEREVAEKGISVGDMQAKLLAKIEELTLYIIAQEKHQKLQDEKIEEQEREIKALRSSKSS